MAHHSFLGRVAPLTVRRFGSPGAFLALDESDSSSGAPVILLPGTEIPEGTTEGDILEVFVYLDSEDRPVATLRSPAIHLGEVAFLRVTAVTEFGAFVEWGLLKDLLVPHAEQTREVRMGDRHPVGLYVDRTGRLAGTMRVTEMLREKRHFELDEWVHGEAWRNEPDVGLFVILERKFVGLVPEVEPHSLSRGDAAKFRVTNILADGKVELSLRGQAYEEMGADAEKVFGLLSTPGSPRLGDKSTPDEIRGTFGLSKKAFKRAVGRLLKEGRVRVDRDGFVVVKGESQ